VDFEPLHPPDDDVAVLNHASPPISASSPDAGQSEAWSVISTPLKVTSPGSKTPYVFPPPVTT
jgi:hypothetical protein